MKRLWYLTKEQIKEQHELYKNMQAQEIKPSDEPVSFDNKS
jgi:hypothetical protein